MPRYRVEVWTQLSDGHVTLQSVTVTDHVALAILCLSLAALQASSGTNLPQIAEIATLH